MALYIGIDVSTSATKAIVVDEEGTVRLTASHPHPLSTPRPLWSEQSPDDWWTATCTALREVADSLGPGVLHVRGIGLTGQMHGLVVLDSSGKVLRPAMLWNDGRSSAQCDFIREVVGKDRLVELTGNDAFAGFTAPKLLWVRDHQPEVYDRIAHVLLPKDYARYRLTGDFATDRAGAGGTLLLDLATRDWSGEILDRLEIPRDWLPPTHEGTAVTGVVSERASEETGLPAGIPVIAGGGDQAAGAVGMGAVTESVVSLTLGTSGVVFASSSEPRTSLEGRAHSFPHAVPERWHMMGVMLSAAGSLEWYRRTCASDFGWEDLLGETATLQPGSDNLFFLPYLTGERTPHANPHATASFVGLTQRHTRAHLTRAVLEGVAYGLRDNLELLLAAGIRRPDEIRIAGGGMKSPIWRTIIANVLNVPLRATQTTEGAAFGAAILAATAGGDAGDVELACDRMVKLGEVLHPTPDTARIYQEHYERFHSLYPVMEQTFSN
jgi:xylulokinase